MTETGKIPAEPATPRALWPTFLCRTLEEEALRPTPHATAGPDAAAG